MYVYIYIYIYIYIHICIYIYIYIYDQCVAVCCSVLQIATNRVAAICNVAHRSVLQCVAACCSVMRSGVAERCRALPSVAVRNSI